MSVISSCNQCHIRPRYYDPIQNKFHNYCSKSCAAAARALQTQSCCSLVVRAFNAVIGSISDCCARIWAVVARALNISQNRAPSTALQHQLNYLANQRGRIDFYKKDDLNPTAPMSLTAFLGNFHESDITLDGYSFPCSEALYQAAKFMDPAQPLNSPYNQSIITQFCNGALNALNDSVGHLSWQIGQRLGNTGFKARPDWQRTNVAIMENILRLKYDQNPVLRQLLQATGNAPLNERTDRDAFWGDGANGKGQNQLGKCHERLRDEMKGGGRLAYVPPNLTAALLFK